MGLDINAYSKVVLVEENADDEWDGRYDWHNHFRAWVNDDFPGRNEPIKHKAIYRCDGSQQEFRAGSYTGYNQWRYSLARFAFNAEADSIWKNPETFAGKPFYELINFADNESIIGSVVSAKLAKDFADWQEAANKHGDEYWRKKYSEWRKAFELASNDGCVVFC